VYWKGERRIATQACRSLEINMEILRTSNGSARNFHLGGI